MRKMYPFNLIGFIVENCVRNQQTGIIFDFLPCRYLFRESVLNKNRMIRHQGPGLLVSDGLKVKSLLERLIADRCREKNQLIRIPSCTLIFAFLNSLCSCASVRKNLLLFWEPLFLKYSRPGLWTVSFSFSRIQFFPVILIKNYFDVNWRIQNFIFPFCRYK